MIWADFYAQLYSLYEELANISQQLHQHIADYFTCMKTLWDKLDHLNPLPMCKCNGCVCGLTKQFLKIQQDQRIMNFLMKLDE